MAADRCGVSAADCSSRSSTASSLPRDAAHRRIDGDRIVAVALENARKRRFLRSRRQLAERRRELTPHSPVCIVEQLHARRPESDDSACAAIAPTSRSADTRTSLFACDNAGITSFGSIASSAVEHPQRFQACAHVGGAQRQLPQRRHDRLVAALDEQLLRHVAAPAVRMRQQLHELRRGVARIGSGVVSRLVLSWTMR